MKKHTNPDGILWKPDKATDYLGISTREAEWLMSDLSIASAYIASSKKPGTIKEQINN